MAISLKNALRAYDRVDVAEIDCGNGWTCEVKSFSSVMKDFAKVQARVRAKGGVQKKAAATASAVLIDNAGNVTVREENPYLLGSYEADVDFFVGYMLIGWRGLTDDNGEEVPYTTDNAKAVFLENGEPARQLMRELLFASLDNKNYVKSATVQAEEDGKN